MKHELQYHQQSADGRKWIVAIASHWSGKTRSAPGAAGSNSVGKFALRLFGCFGIAFADG